MKTTVFASLLCATLIATPALGNSANPSTVSNTKQAPAIVTKFNPQPSKPILEIQKKAQTRLSNIEHDLRFFETTPSTDIEVLREHFQSLEKPKRRTTAVYLMHRVQIGDAQPSFQLLSNDPEVKINTTPKITREVSRDTNIRNNEELAEKISNTFVATYARDLEVWLLMFLPIILLGLAILGLIAMFGLVSA